MKPCVQPHLAEAKQSRSSRIHIVAKTGSVACFEIEFPVIFAATDAKFGLMASDIRIAEQVHGGLRDSLLSVKSRMTRYPEEAHNPFLSLATHCRASINA